MTRRAGLVRLARELGLNRPGYPVPKLVARAAVDLGVPLRIVREEVSLLPLLDPALYIIEDPKDRTRQLVVYEPLESAA